MRTETICGRKVEIYDSIEELPMARFHRYNKYLLVDAGVGSDIASFDSHLEKAIAYVRSSKADLAEAELDNLRQCVYMVQTQVSPRYLSFAALVKSIDGQPCDDISDDGLQRVVERLNNAPIGRLTAILEAVKKKIDRELQTYFPRLFDSATTKECLDLMRRRALLQLDEIIEGENEKRTAQIERLTDELLMYHKPQQFAGADSVEVAHDKHFERMNLLLSQNLNVDPKRYTVLEYYNAFELLHDQMKEQEKRTKKRK